MIHELASNLPAGDLCTALFPEGDPPKRRLVRNYQLISRGGVEVTFTGSTLGPRDFDHLAQIFEFAREQVTPGDLEVCFPPQAFVEAIDCNTGMDPWEYTQKATAWLQMAVVCFKVGMACYQSALFWGIRYDHEIDICSVEINPHVAQLLGFDLTPTFEPLKTPPPSV